MRKGKVYFQLQFRRFVRFLPVMIAVMLMLCAGVSALGWILLGRAYREDARQKVRVGVVGDATDSYLGMGISMIENLDSTGLMVEFENLDEEEAEEELKQGRLSAYIQIPEDFLGSVLRGENRQITYVTTDGNPGLTDLLVDELTEVVSVMLTQTQTGIYGMQQYMAESGQREKTAELTEDMNIQYIRLVLERETVSRVKELGVAEGLSLKDSFLCGLVVLVLLFWGVAGAPLLVRQDMSLYRMLFSEGLGAGAQVLCEYGVWYLFMAVWGVLGCAGFGIWLGRNLFSGLFLVIAMICAMEFFFYELVSGILNGVVLQFINAVIMGYLSGCFYPSCFFPESIQRIGRMLPSGAALHFLAESAYRDSGNGGVMVAGYLALFFGLSVVLRRYRMGHA